ncbi:hypothetical protein, partial [Paramagnetospirillum caucaseum]|uniref:hypothetical protein n=1 Tax=Paramagnetospirillum caucaseum TaxID=1244869 RepID=UPI001F33CA1C
MIDDGYRDDSSANRRWIAATKVFSASDLIIGKLGSSKAVIADDLVRECYEIMDASASRARPGVMIGIHIYNFREH